MTRATKHEIQHFMIETYNNVTFIEKFLVAEKIFKEILDCGSEDNGKNTNTNLF